MAYWLMSSEMAWRAASLISSGAAKSGKPCFFDFFGGGEIGKTLGEIDGVVLHGQSGHFADDGFGELLGLGGEHSAREMGHVGFGSGHWKIVAKRSRGKRVLPQRTRSAQRRKGADGKRFHAEWEKRRRRGRREGRGKRAGRARPLQRGRRVSGIGLRDRVWALGWRRRRCSWAFRCRGRGTFRCCGGRFGRIRAFR